MQLAILISLVRARGKSLPEKRTALYDLYVDLFFDREAEKSAIVRRNRELLKAIHQYLAWHLQAEAQTDAGNGAIADEDLKALVRSFLAGRGHDENLAEEIFQGVTERVVALVSRVEGSFEFEVQPLREYFAARYLYETAPMYPAAESRSGTRPERLAALLRDPYWLNVARFFAGCHTVGELAGVADKLDELVREPLFSRLAHPRSLGAMLLSDWVFAQDPRSKQRVLSAVLERPNWRLMIAGERIRRGGATLVLPPPEGGNELLQQALTALQEGLPSDLESEVIQLVLLNGTPSSIRSGWASESRPVNEGSWWRIGARVGAINFLPDAELEELLAKGDDDRDKVLALVQAGRSDVVDRSPRRLRLAVDAVLDGHGAFVDFRRVGPVECLSLIFGPHRLGSFQARNRISLVDEVQAVADADMPDGPVADEVRLVLREYVSAIRSGSDAMDGRRKALATASALWGDRDALWRLALILVRRSRPQTIEPLDLDDMAVDLIELVSYARAQAGGVRWWSEQLGRVSDRIVPKVALAISLTGPRTLGALGELLDIRVREMTTEDLSRIDLVSRFQGVQPNRTSSTLALATPSASLVALLWPRLDRETRLRSRDVLFDYGGPDQRVLSLAANESVREALGGRLGWSSALDIVEASYAHSRAGLLNSALRTDADATETSRLPARSQIDRVLSSPEVFPGALVAWLERSERQRVFSATPTVPMAAKRGHWFEDSVTASTAAAR